MGKIINYSKLLVVFILLSGCTPVTSVMSVAANAGISSKGFSASLDDSILKSKIIARISLIKISNLTNITVSVSVGEILLTGYIEDQASRLKIVEEIWKIDGVLKVYNELRIDSSISFSERTEDNIFESRLMTRLLFKSGVNSNNYSIDVVGGTVYVIGLAENLDEKTNIENFLGNMNDISKLVTIINLKKKDTNN